MWVDHRFSCDSHKTCLWFKETQSTTYISKTIRAIQSNICKSEHREDTNNLKRSFLYEPKNPQVPSNKINQFIEHWQEESRLNVKDPWNTFFVHDQNYFEFSLKDRVPSLNTTIHGYTSLHVLRRQKRVRLLWPHLTTETGRASHLRSNDEYLSSLTFHLVASHGRYKPSPLGLHST